MLNLGPGQTRYGKPGGCDVTNQTTGSGMQQLRHQLRDWPNELLSQQLAGSHSLGCIVQTHGINVWRPGCALSYPAGRSGGATCPTTACTVSFGWLASDHANPTAPVASILPPPRSLLAHPISHNIPATSASPCVRHFGHAAKPDVEPLRRGGRVHRPRPCPVRVPRVSSGIQHFKKANTLVLPSDPAVARGCRQGGPRSQFFSAATAAAPMAPPWPVTGQGRPYFANVV